MGKAVPDLAALKFQAICLELGCEPLHLAQVIMAESGWYPNAHNLNGHASGLFQAMPATLKGLGYAPGLDPVARAESFRGLTAAEQMPWLRRYYMPYKGRLGSLAACYLSTFMPAYLDHANEPGVVLASKGLRGFIYNANRGFDANGDMSISVSELALACGRAARGNRWSQVVVDISLGVQAPVNNVPGSAGTRDVIAMQQRLLSKGHSPGPIDGAIGPKTYAALVAFQRANGLKPDGIAGPLTWAKLEAP